MKAYFEAGKLSDLSQQQFMDDLELMHDDLKELMGQVSLMQAVAKAEEVKVSGAKQSYAEKKELARLINQACRDAGVRIAHPVDGAGCILLAISDVWGGKYTLENCDTKKRSHTSRELGALLPFKFVSLEGMVDILAE